MWVKSRIFEVFSGTKKSGDGLTGMSKDEIRTGRIRGKMTSDEVSSNFFPHPLHLPPLEVGAHSVGLGGTGAQWDAPEKP